MSYMNRVIIMGNLAADPEVRQVAGGKAMTKMKVAVNRNWRGADGTPQKRVDFFGVVTWSSTAENCAKYLVKGRPVLVEGSLMNHSWDGPDGKKRWMTDIQATAVHFLNGREHTATNGADPQADRVVAEPDESSHPIDSNQDGESPIDREDTESSASTRAARSRSARPAASNRRSSREASSEVPF